MATCKECDPKQPEKPKEECTTCANSMKETGSVCFNNPVLGGKCKWKPIPKEPEKKCEACRFYSGNNNGRFCSDHPECPKGSCSYNDNLPFWQPIEKPTKSPKQLEAEALQKASSMFTHWPEPKMPSKADREEIVRLTDKLLTPKKSESYRRKQAEYHRMRQAIAGINPPLRMYKKPKPNKVKEKTTMFKRTLHLYRMAGTLWLLWGHILVCMFINPWLLRLMNWIPCLLPDAERVVDGEIIMVPREYTRGTFIAWMIAILAIAALCLAFWAWSKFTTFWHNEKKQQGGEDGRRQGCFLRPFY